MEKGDKQISRSWIPRLAELFDINEDELVILWLADKITKILKNEPGRIDRLDQIKTHQP